MSDPVEPSGVQMEYSDSGVVIMHFNHEAIPPIKLTSTGAMQVGSNLHSAANRTGGETYE